MPVRAGLYLLRRLLLLRETVKYVVAIAILLTLAFAVLRFIVPTRGLDLTVPTVFKDLAHVFVGMLFGALFLGMVMVCVDRRVPGWHKSDQLVPVDDCVRLGLFCGILGAGLTVVEVVAALIR